MNPKYDEIFDMRDDAIESFEWAIFDSSIHFDKLEIRTIMNGIWYLTIAEIKNGNEACWFCGETYCKGHSESELKADALEW